MSNDGGPIMVPTPSLQSLQKANQSLSTNNNVPWPLDRKICFGVSVTASNLPFTESPCSPRLGVISGFVEAGVSLEVLVPRGSARNIILYSYLQSPGMACPTMQSKFPVGFSQRTYKVGEVKNINLLDSQQTVDITAAFPGLNQSVAVQQNFSASCFDSIKATNSKFQISSSTGSSSNANFRLQVRVGRVFSGDAMTSANYRLQAVIR